MRALFAGTLISSENLAHGRVGSGASWNGEPVVDEVLFFRAANTAVWGRADGPERFALQVWRFFGSEAAALTFAGTHRSTLPLEGDLVLVDDVQSVALRMAGAVRGVQIAERRGLAVLVQYTFTGSRFVSDDVPGDPDDPSNVKTGVIDLEIDDEEKAVVFAVPFGAEPNFVNAVVSVPVGEAGLRAHPVEGTISASGFTAKLSAIVTVEGCKLRYFAAL